MRRPLRGRPGLQGGFTLLELALAMSVVTIGLTVGVWAQLQDLNAEKAMAQGRQLKALGRAMRDYMANNYLQLVNAQPVPGVAVPTAPTVAELVNLRLLDGAYSSTNLYGSAYQNTVTLTPAGCLPDACDLSSLSYMTGPLQVPGRGGMVVDGSLLGSAIQAIGADGGASSPSNAGTVTGFDGLWSFANPLGTTAGVVAVRARYDASTQGNFARLDGTLAFKGDQSMGGFALKGVDTVEMVSNAANAANSPCPVQGAITADATGNMLMCVAGKWAVGGQTKGKYGFFATAACPMGWVMADGANGTLDLRGQFARGWNNSGSGTDAGRGEGTQQASAEQAHEHGVSTYGNNDGRFLTKGTETFVGQWDVFGDGSLMLDMYQFTLAPDMVFDTRNGNFAGGWNGAGHKSLNTYGGPLTAWNGAQVTMGWKSSLDRAVTNVPGLAPEMRPENVALTPCMKT